MTDAAIISAAGWKGAGCLHGLGDCPEPLLPLGDGTTPVSRLSGQLGRLGFTVIIGVGRPGCLYPRLEEHFSDHPEKRYVLEDVTRAACTVSPWTEERVDYVAQHGRVVLVDDPNGAMSRDTHYRAMDAVGDPWDRLLLLCGDYLFSDGLLRDIVQLSGSFWLSMYRHGHDVFMLTPQTAGYWRSYTSAYRFRGCVHRTPEMLNQHHQEFTDAGISHIWAQAAFPGRNDEFCDLDVPEGCPSSYEHAIEWMERWG